MEGVLGSIFEKFKRREKKLALRSNELSRELWNYTILREYLLSLSHGSEFLLPVDEYPNEIELSKDWHDILDGIRKDSRDGFERLSLVGINGDKRALYLQSSSVTGLPDRVSSSVISTEIQRAKEKYHISIVAGDIHSHPSSLLDLIWGSQFSNKRGMFSAGDLYRMVVPDNNLIVMGIVDGGDNVFAFRSRESTTTGLISSIFSQEAFEKYWYERNGFRYLGGVEKYGAQRVTAVSPQADSWNVNLNIADRHNLVLYRGISGGKLGRVFPVQKIGK